jgi:PBP1b-binding outer membrane lipoprotein LpoB
MKIIAFVSCLALFLCSCASNNNSIQSEGVLVRIGERDVSVQLISAGSFSTVRTMPLSEKHVFKLDGKEVPAEKLVEGRQVRIYRDPKTQKVNLVEE